MSGRELAPFGNNQSRYNQSAKMRYTPPTPAKRLPRWSVVPDPYLLKKKDPSDASSEEPPAGVVNLLREVLADYTEAVNNMQAELAEKQDPTSIWGSTAGAIALRTADLPPTQAEQINLRQRSQCRINTDCRDSPAIPSWLDLVSTRKLTAPPAAKSVPGLERQRAALRPGDAAMAAHRVVMKDLSEGFLSATFKANARALGYSDHDSSDESDDELERHSDISSFDSDRSL
jgi:hypothetical protein